MCLCVAVGIVVSEISSGPYGIYAAVRVGVGSIVGLLVGLCVLVIQYYFELIASVRGCFDYILVTLPFSGMVSGAFIVLFYYTDDGYYRDLIDIVPDALKVVMGCVIGLIFGLFVSLTLRWWRWEWNQATNPKYRSYFN